MQLEELNCFASDWEEEKGGEDYRGLDADTQTPSPAICVANEGAKGLSSDPIQGHITLPAGWTVNRSVGMHGL
jgi:hypothetical protein